MQLQVDAKAREILRRNPDSLLESELKLANFAASCSIEGTRKDNEDAIRLRCPDTRAAVTVKESEFRNPGKIQEILRELQDSVRTA
jgi:hypothetical protein